MAFWAILPSFSSLSHSNAWTPLSTQSGGLLCLKDRSHPRLLNSYKSENLNMCHQSGYSGAGKEWKSFCPLVKGRKFWQFLHILFIESKGKATSLRHLLWESGRGSSISSWDIFFAPEIFGASFILQLAASGGSWDPKDASSAVLWLWILMTSLYCSFSNWQSNAAVMRMITTRFTRVGL